MLTAKRTRNASWNHQVCQTPAAKSVPVICGAAVAAVT
jgi:hypothetical protein